MVGVGTNLIMAMFYVQSLFIALSRNVGVCAVLALSFTSFTIYSRHLILFFNKDMKGASVY